MPHSESNIFNHNEVETFSAPHDMSRHPALGNLQKIVHVTSGFSAGSQTFPITLEFSFARGFVGFNILGGAAGLSQNSKERVRTALEHCHVHLPAKRLVVNLSPGDLHIDGTHLDLALAVGIALLLHRGPSPVNPKSWFFAAELGISGSLKPVPSMAPHLLTTLQYGLEGIVASTGNAEEIERLSTVARDLHAPQLKVLTFDHLSEVLGWLDGKSVETPTIKTARPEISSPYLGPTYDDMILQPDVERAVLAAATGGHNIILRGTPGSGKSMLAERLPSILPSLTAEDQLASMVIHSQDLQGIPPCVMAGQPPFRAPHHLTSTAAMLGTHQRPGEVSLATGGVLFLDELPEFRRDVLEGLREPLESGRIHVSRAQGKCAWDARFLFIGAANNCPCGWAGSKRRLCLCPHNRLQAYRSRLSGPLLDRIDLHINMPDRINSGPTRPTFANTGILKTRVVEARSRGSERNAALGIGLLNRDTPSSRLAEALQLSEQELYQWQTTLFPNSATTRSMVRCLRVARTLADLDQRDGVGKDLVQEALRWQFEESARARGEDVGA